MSSKRKHAHTPGTAVGGAASKKSRLEGAWFGGVTAESANEALRDAKRQHKAEIKRVKAELKAAMDAREREARAHAEEYSAVKNSVRAQRAHAALTSEKVLSLEAQLINNKKRSDAVQKKLKDELEGCKAELVIEKQNCAAQKILVEDLRKKTAKYRGQRDALRGSVNELTDKTKELTAVLKNAQDQLKTIEEVAHVRAASEIRAAEAKRDTALEAYHEEVKTRQLAEVMLNEAQEKIKRFEAQFEQLRKIEKQKEEWRTNLMRSSSALRLEDEQAADEVSQEVSMVD